MCCVLSPSGSPSSERLLRVLCDPLTALLETVGGSPWPPGEAWSPEQGSPLTGGAAPSSLPVLSCNASGHQQSPSLTSCLCLEQDPLPAPRPSSALPWQIPCRSQLHPFLTRVRYHLVLTLSQRFTALPCLVSGCRLHDLKNCLVTLLILAECVEHTWKAAMGMQRGQKNKPEERRREEEGRIECLQGKEPDPGNNA